MATSRQLIYDDRVIGSYYYPGRCLDWTLDEFKLLDLLSEMPLNDKLHMSTNAADVLKLVKDEEIPEEIYLTDDEVAIYCADQGYTSMKDLKKNDKKVWQIVRNRNLRSEIFGSVGESDEN